MFEFFSGKKIYPMDNSIGDKVQPFRIMEFEFLRHASKIV
jgi:hypothetical protein